MAALHSTSSLYDRTEEVRKFDESKSGVKGLSDSGITSIPKFFIHSPQALAYIKNTKLSDQTTVSIPIIDLSDTNRTKLTNQVKEAASSWGFFQVINHGISNSVLDSTITAYKAFHEQPHDVKSSYYKREEHCGVMFATNNDLYRSEAASWHDQLQAWMGPKELDPEELPEVCRKEVIEWDKCAMRVAETVMELLSEGLGLE